MRFLITCALILHTVSSAFAESSHGGAHHASIGSLVAPMINVVILFGVLVWKLKKPLHDFFVNKSQDVSNTLERASLKSKEAQMMLEGESRKMSNLQNEIKSIQQQVENDVVAFEKKLAKETEEKSQKLKTDANSKIQADKKALMDELNAELLNQVIAKTKSTIKTNKDYQNKVSSKLLQGL